MAYNDFKILNIMYGELASVPERYDGYKKDMTHLIFDVLLSERENLISKTNIVQQIGSKINAIGLTLHKHRTANKQ